jgi:two-component system, chemotaxis family, chemotaxis protein CheY
MGAKGYAALRVVIIDDSEHMRTLLHTMLRGAGIRQVHEADNGEAGLDLVKSHSPEFVLTDYSMKPVNGVEFVKTLRRLDSPLAWIPVIMVTGHTERHHIEQARDAGITEILCKPITVKGLFQKITEVVERPRRFVKSQAFIGPDRRRRHDGYTGPRRRQDDSGTALV